MNHTDLKPQLCPICGAMANAASSVEGTWTPKPGDCVVCLECGGYNKFDEQMNLKKMSAPDLYLLSRDDPEAFMKLVEVGMMTEMFWKSEFAPRPTKTVKN